MLFKGTPTRSAEEIAQQVDSIGGQIDAFTSKEYAGYYLKVLDEHLPLAVDILADLICNPLFAEEDIEREKKVILEEIKMVEDTPDDLVHELFAEGFWSNHPLGRPILGTPESVSALDRADAARTTSPRPTSRRTSSSSPSAISNTRACRTCSSARSPARRTTAPDGRSVGAEGRHRHPGPQEGARAEPHRVRHRGAAAAPSRALRRLRAQHHARRLDELAAVPERAREARPGLFGLLRALGLSGCRRAQHLRRLRQRRGRRADRRRRRRNPADEGRRPRSRSSCAAPRITSRAR